MSLKDFHSFHKTLQARKVFPGSETRCSMNLYREPLLWKYNQYLIIINIIIINIIIIIIINIIILGLGDSFHNWMIPNITQ